MNNRIEFLPNKELLASLDILVREGLGDRESIVEKALKRFVYPRILRKAFVLCGGEGTRLRPLTYEIPKPLIPVHGKPVIEHIFDLLRKYEINDIVLSIGYKKDKFYEMKPFWERSGLRITFVEEDEPLGTGGPLRLAKDIFRHTFIMSNGDELKDIDIFSMYEAHRRNRAWVTIALRQVDNPSAYGVAKVDGERIVEFIEKPKGLKSGLINSGFYIVEPDVIDMIPNGKCSFEREILPELAKQGKLFGFVFEGQWFDTGNFERYEKALKEWKGIKME